MIRQSCGVILCRTDARLQLNRVDGAAVWQEHAAELAQSEPGESRLVKTVSVYK